MTPEEAGPGPDGGSPPATDPRERLAGALRRITDLAVGRPIDDAELAAAAGEAEALADRLARVAGEGRRQLVLPGRAAAGARLPPGQPGHRRGQPDRPAGRGVVGDHRRGPPEPGAAGSPSASPTRAPPGLVHGGVLAMVCDDMLGAANMMAGEPGVTAMLTVRYRKPVPVATELTLEARLVERSGRKITTWGGILLDGEVLAEGEGLFIAMKAERMLERHRRPAAAPGPA